VDPTFTELYRAHYPAVLRFVRRRAREADVDDVVSETFLTAWRRQEQMAAAPLPWLYRTARNVILNSNRAEGRRAGLAVRIASLREEEPTDPIVRFEQQHDLSRVWGSLDPLDQEVLALQVWEGLNGKETASVLGISRAACAMRATRARRRLVAVLDATLGAADPEPPRASQAARQAAGPAASQVTRLVTPQALLIKGETRA
jgi:RNA polymerase sigma-70 factor, ECF subfamily